jgi:hypothetical protein
MSDDTFRTGYTVGSTNTSRTHGTSWALVQSNERWHILFSWFDRPHSYLISFLCYTKTWLIAIGTITARIRISRLILRWTVARRKSIAWWWNYRSGIVVLKANNNKRQSYLYVYAYVHAHVYVYIYVHVYVHMYMYISIEFIPFFVRLPWNCLLCHLAVDPSICLRGLLLFFLLLYSSSYCGICAPVVLGLSIIGNDKIISIDNDETSHSIITETVQLTRASCIHNH